MRSTLIWVRENLIAPLLLAIGAGVWSNFVQNGESIRRNAEELKMITFHIEKSNKNDAGHDSVLAKIDNTTEILKNYYINHSVNISELEANQKSIIREMAELKEDLRNKSRGF